MAEEKDVETAEGGGKKKLILIVVGALLLVGISVGATLMLLGGGEEEVAAEDPGPVKGEPTYVELKPFTVNLSPDDPVGFLQIQIEMLSYYSEVTEQLEKHKPLIRNDLTVLFAQQKSADLRSVEGKQMLQQQVVEKIQGVIERYGKGGEVENAFFVNFVMQ